MIISKRHVAWVALCSAAECAAQKPEHTTPSLYASLCLASAHYTVIYKPSGFATAIPLSPWRVAAGYQFTPRLGLEVSGMYRAESSAGSATGTTTIGQPVRDYTTEKSRSGALPVVARYSLSARPARPWHMEVLAGVTVTKTRAESSYTHTVGGQIVTDRQDVNHKTSLYYTAGLGVRYRFGQHWQAVADWTINRNTERLSAAISQQVLGRSIDLTYAYGLGVRYCFRLKPTVSQRPTH
ncbi:hypothetical protein E5K00_21115 [Hymenobacter aquaticus]|uniref:Outer membrane protein beta-barrel domain-containing protein n=1 Tax=Hymenobacter aquaticus TaxID=1867101 RepID=A0A4Z0PT80_9BACT|nr:outer membrane beta-barrel protein [Hymenobacter aquaticus]TGE20499.1 hypothetical protein E5K00_21115 [Hymenobacter aquaticus]